MRQLFTFVVTAFLTALVGTAAGEGKSDGVCGRRDLAVTSASSRQLDEVCAALDEVQAFFAAIGFKVDPQVTIVFRKDTEGDAGDRHTHGNYNAVTRTIKLYERQQARPWGEAWPHVAATYLRHEVIHAAVVQLLASGKPDLPLEWHEFIAYAIQFELMESAVRERILERYASVVPVSALTEINRFTYGLADPDTFAVLAYRSYHAFGGSDLIRRLLAFEFVPMPIEMMMPFPPN